MKNIQKNVTAKTTEVKWEIKDKFTEKSETLIFNHSKHSFRRASKRNISQQNIADVIEHGRAFFKQGMIFYVLGEHQLPDAKVKKGHDKSQNMVVVIAGDSNTILTCYRSKNPFKHIKKKQKNLARKYSTAA
jgi:hypothetical protein